MLRSTPTDDTDAAAEAATPASANGSTRKSPCDESPDYIPLSPSPIPMPPRRQLGRISRTMHAPSLDRLKSPVARRRFSSSSTAVRQGGTIEVVDVADSSDDARDTDSDDEFLVTVDTVPAAVSVARRTITKVTKREKRVVRSRTVAAMEDIFSVKSEPGIESVHGKGRFPHAASRSGSRHASVSPPATQLAHGHAQDDETHGDTNATTAVMTAHLADPLSLTTGSFFTGMDLVPADANPELGDWRARKPHPRSASPIAVKTEPGVPAHVSRVVVEDNDEDDSDVFAFDVVKLPVVRRDTEATLPMPAMRPRPRGRGVERRVESQDEDEEEEEEEGEVRITDKQHVGGRSDGAREMEGESRRLRHHNSPGPPDIPDVHLSPESTSQVSDATRGNVWATASVPFGRQPAERSTMPALPPKPTMGASGRHVPSHKSNWPVQSYATSYRDHHDDGHVSRPRRCGADGYRSDRDEYRPKRGTDGHCSDRDEPRSSQRARRDGSHSDREMAMEQQSRSRPAATANQSEGIESVASRLIRRHVGMHTSANKGTGIVAPSSLRRESDSSFRGRAASEPPKLALSAALPPEAPSEPSDGLRSEMAERAVPSPESTVAKRASYKAPASRSRETAQPAPAAIAKTLMHQDSGVTEEDTVNTRAKDREAVEDAAEMRTNQEEEDGRQTGDAINDMDVDEAPLPPSIQAVVDRLGDAEKQLNKLHSHRQVTTGRLIDLESRIARLQSAQPPAPPPKIDLSAHQLDQISALVLSHLGRRPTPPPCAATLDSLPPSLVDQLDCQRKADKADVSGMLERMHEDVMRHVRREQERLELRMRTAVEEQLEVVRQVLAREVQVLASEVEQVRQVVQRVEETVGAVEERVVACCGQVAEVVTYVSEQRNGVGELQDDEQPIEQDEIEEVRASNAACPAESSDKELGPKASAIARRKRRKSHSKGATEAEADVDSEIDDRDQKRARTESVDDARRTGAIQQDSALLDQWRVVSGNRVGPTPLTGWLGSGNASTSALKAPDTAPSSTALPSTPAHSATSESVHRPDGSSAAKALMSANQRSFATPQIHCPNAGNLQQTPSSSPATRESIAAADTPLIPPITFAQPPTLVLPPALGPLPTATTSTLSNSASSSAVKSVLIVTADCTSIRPPPPPQNAASHKKLLVANTPAGKTHTGVAQATPTKLASVKNQTPSSTPSSKKNHQPNPQQLPPAETGHNQTPTKAPAKKKKKKNKAKKSPTPPGPTATAVTPTPALPPRPLPAGHVAPITHGHPQMPSDGGSVVSAQTAGEQSPQAQSARAKRMATITILGIVGSDGVGRVNSAQDAPSTANGGAARTLGQEVSETANREKEKEHVDDPMDVTPPNPVLGKLARAAPVSVQVAAESPVATSVPTEETLATQRQKATVVVNKVKEQKNGFAMSGPTIF